MESLRTSDWQRINGEGRRANWRCSSPSPTDGLAPDRLPRSGIDALTPLSARNKQVPVESSAGLEKGSAVSRIGGRSDGVRFVDASIATALSRCRVRRVSEDLGDERVVHASFAGVVGSLARGHLVMVEHVAVVVCGSLVLLDRCLQVVRGQHAQSSERMQRKLTVHFAQGDTMWSGTRKQVSRRY